MKNIISLILIGLLLIIVSCKKDNKPVNEPFIENDSANNNSAILIGDSIGDNSEPLDSLWKIGKVIIENQSNDYSVDTVYFTRHSTNSDHINWIIPIRNISENSNAFIEATDIIFLDKDNNIISQQPDNFTFVNGSCGTAKKQASIITNTFLRPNELGYLLGIESININTVAKIKIGSITNTENEFYYSNINVIPTSYNAPDHIFYHELNLNIKNESNQAVYVTSSFYLLLDQTNRPLLWSFFSINESDELIMPANSTASMINKYSFYDGICNKIQPILRISYNSWGYKSAISNKSSMNNDELNRDFMLQRDNKIKQKLQNYRKSNI